MKKLNLVSNIFKLENLRPKYSLKIVKEEFHIEELNNKVFIFISPILRYNPHKVYLEELIENKELLNKLDRQSISYIFYIYGVLRASEKNNLYTIEEFSPINQTIKVKNLTTLALEEWDQAYLFTNQKYMLLDKQSLFQAMQFFIQYKNENNNYDMSPNKQPNIRLIK